VDAGSLPHRVSIEVRTETSDNHGGFTESWAVRHRRIAARVTPLTGRDLERAKAIDPRIGHEVTLRYWRAYRDDLAGGRTQMVYHDLDDRTLEIITPPVDVDHAHDAVTVFCRELA